MESDLVLAKCFDIIDTCKKKAMKALGTGRLIPSHLYKSQHLMLKPFCHQ